jgi:hypothetical protein
MEVLNSNVGELEGVETMLLNQQNFQGLLFQLLQVTCGCSTRKQLIVG